MQTPTEPSQNPDSTPETGDSSDPVAAPPARIEPVRRFKDLPVEDVVKAGIDHFGYATPTPIQQTAIPTLVAGRDLIGLAPTGTGKTLAYGIPMAHRLIAEPPPMLRRVKKRKGGDAGGRYVLSLIHI